MARLLQCGFEEQSLTAGVEIDTITTAGAMSVQNTTARLGGYALEINPAAQTAAAQFNLYSAQQHRKVTVRTYVNVSVLPGVAIPVVTLIGGGVGYGRVVLNPTGTLALQNNAGTQIGAVSPVLALNTWYRIDLQVDGTASPGTCTAQLNTVQFASGANGTQANIAAVLFGATGTSATYTTYLDDIAVNDDTGGSETGYPEDGHIVHMHPAATGDSNGFLINVGGTAGAANNFTRVNEIPPDDATSYNATLIPNASDLMACGSAPSIPMTVNAVMIGGRAANLTGADATSALKWQVEKTTGGTVSQSAATIPNSTTWATNPKQPGASAYPLVLVNDPDGSPWTSTTLGTIQIGYKLTAAGTHQIAVSNVWASIDFPVWLTASVTDTAVATDVAVTGTAIRLRSVIDFSVAFDVATRTGVGIRTASDNAVATDVAAFVQRPFRSASDTAIATDVATKHQPVKVRQAIDHALAVDIATWFKASNSGFMGQGFVGGQITGYGGHFLVVLPVEAKYGTSGLMGQGLMGQMITGYKARNQRLTGAKDTAIAFDVAKAQEALVPTATDQAIATDVATRVAPNIRSASDPAVAVDVAVGQRGRLVTAADSAIATDVAAPTRGQIRGASDQAIALDIATGQYGAAGVATDVAVAVDVAVGPSGATRTATDTAQATDVAGGNVARFRAAVDVAVAVDVAGRVLTVGGIATDVATATDVASRAGSTVRTVADTALATDQAETSRQPAHANDVALARDFVNTGFARRANDAAGAVDVAIAFSSAPRSASDTAQAVDSATAVPVIPRVAIDTALAVDIATSIYVPTHKAYDVAIALDVATAATGTLFPLGRDNAIAVDMATVFVGYSPRTWVFGTLVPRWRFGQLVTSTRPLVGTV